MLHAAIVGAALAINLIGGGKATQPEVGAAGEVILIPVGDGAAAWVHSPRDGLEYCYIDGSRMRCIARRGGPKATSLRAASS